MTTTEMTSDRKLNQQAAELARRLVLSEQEQLTPEQLLHELRIHKIELEMQNEELRQAQVALGIERSRYFTLYDLAPVGYFLIGEHGIIQDANLTASTLLGVPRSALHKQRFTRFVFPEDQDIKYRHGRKLDKTGEPQTYELRMVKGDGAIFWAHLVVTVTQGPAGAPVHYFAVSDITERKSLEEEKERAARLIQMINTQNDLQKCMSAVTAAIQGWSGCEAVGIRMQEGNDYPYYETCGFPSAFVHAENKLCAYGPDGKILKDGEGNPVLECMCGNILCGKFDPAKPFFTPHGSFWSNGTSALLASTTESDRLARTRNRCNGEGYESVALIPLKVGNQVFGLLQLNDHRPDRFTLTLIEHLERMADTVAIWLSRHQAEEALRHSESFLRESQLVGRIGSYDYDIPADVWTSTEALDDIFGIDDSFLRNTENFLSLIAPDYQEQMRTYLLHVVIGLNQPFDLEYPVHRKNDGVLRWVHGYGKLHLDASGKAVRMVGTIHDITERKLAEENLRKNRALLSSIINGTTDVIYVKDLQGRYLLINTAAERFLGKGAADVLGTDDYYILSPDEAKIAMEIDRSVIEGGAVTTYEEQITGADGETVTFLTTKGPLCNDAGESVGLFGIARDISESKQTMVELAQAKAAAESANIAKSRFLATMSHEIRTPMNGVIGMIELLKHTELTPEQREFADSAEKSGIELVHLLNDILDLAKIEADKIELEKSDFDLLQELSGPINILSRTAFEKGIQLTSSIDSDVPASLKGDPGRLRQIITNLVGNAIKFTHEGTVTLQVRKDAEDAHTATLSFLVHDSGIGIASGKLVQVFEPFTQADSSITRTYGGTGLGLAICKQLVEMMGGSIGVESTEGQGSTFWFTVVLEKQAASALLSISRSEGEQGIRNGRVGLRSHGIRILLTEDDPKAQKIVPRLLGHYGYQVDVARNGKEAVQALQNDNYALVLMDCMMPEMSGFEAAEIIRDPASSVRQHDIPIIALSGNAMKQDRDKCISAGMNDHLPKPLVLEELLAKLDYWLMTKA